MQVLQFLVFLATGFIGMFQKGGTQFVGLVTGIVPLLIVLMTAVNALVRFIGPERIDRVAMVSSRNIFLRYLVLPFLAVFFLTNPMAYTLGRFLPEKQKPAFYDSAVSFVHPILGLFPHANPGEIFVWAGIAVGITTLKLNVGDLAIRYFLVGLVVIFMRGVLTERITAVMWARRPVTEAGEDGEVHVDDMAEPGIGASRVDVATGAAYIATDSAEAGIGMSHVDANFGTTYNTTPTSTAYIASEEA